MAESNPHITTLTLNVNGLNAPMKRQETGKLDKKPKPIGVLYPGNPSHIQGYIKAQNKGMEKDLPSKGRAEKAGVAILISDKIDFKPTKIKKTKKDIT